MSVKQLLTTSKIWKETDQLEVSLRLGGIQNGIFPSIGWCHKNCKIYFFLKFKDGTTRAKKQDISFLFVASAWKLVEVESF